MSRYVIFSFYRFVDINNKISLKHEIENFLLKYSIKGTVLIADEGINGSLAGLDDELNSLIKYIKSKLKIKTINLKINEINFIPFNRLKIRLKKEIVSLGQGDLNVKKGKAKIIRPDEWDKTILDEDFKIIDTRNMFEIEIGSFKNSINPNTKSFREFPSKFEKLNIDKKSKIAMFCTGGIRCEKASIFLKKNGFKNVYQLDGGIINYLNYIKQKNIKNSGWRGDCFVFDGRVTINKSLEKGKYIQCYGCRRPIRKKDTKSKNYKKGIHCPYCVSERTEIQKKRSADRQKQIENKLTKLN
tara:strand:+ start:1022 stop:1921 length:900 start_codon:yes stop_codon:yes gene_type:complete